MSSPSPRVCKHRSDTDCVVAGGILPPIRLDAGQESTKLPSIFTNPKVYKRVGQLLLTQSCGMLLSYLCCLSQSGPRHGGSQMQVQDRASNRERKNHEKLRNLPSSSMEKTGEGSLEQKVPSQPQGGDLAKEECGFWHQTHLVRIDLRSMLVSSSLTRASIKG